MRCTSDGRSVLTIMMLCGPRAKRAIASPPPRLAGLRGEAQKVAVEVAPYRQHGMGQQMESDLAAIELVGDGIDQERHVVVDDLDDGVTAFEAVIAAGGIEYPDLGDAGQAA